MRRADGDYRWFLIRGVPLRDERGNIVKWYGTGYRYRGPKSGAGGATEQAGLLNLTHDTVFVRDKHDVITYWNRGAEALYGWTKAEALGKVTHQPLQTLFPAPLHEIIAQLTTDGPLGGRARPHRQMGQVRGGEPLGPAAHPPGRPGRPRDEQRHH